MGGLSRKFTVVQKIRQNEDIDHLLLDSGNFLFNTQKQASRKNGLIQTAEGIARIYQEMGYDAVNIGPNDLAAGIGFLKKLDYLPLISASFYDSSGKTIFKPYVIKTYNNHKYAIIGLSSPSPITSTEYIYRPWRTALAPLLPKLEEEINCIILLSSLNENENKEISQEFPGIRIIFSAISTSGNISPRIKNQTIITQTANRGKYLGQLYLRNPGIYDWLDSSISNMAEPERLRKAIKYRLSRIDFLMKQNSNQDTLKTLNKQKIALLEKLDTLEKDKSDEAVALKSTFKAAFTPLTSNIDENRRINEMIKEIKRNAGSSKN